MKVKNMILKMFALCVASTGFVIIKQFLPSFSNLNCVYAMETVTETVTETEISKEIDLNEAELVWREICNQIDNVEELVKKGKKISSKKILKALSNIEENMFYILKKITQGEIDCNLKSFAIWCVNYLKGCVNENSIGRIKNLAKFFCEKLLDNGFDVPNLKEILEGNYNEEILGLKIMNDFDDYNVCDFIDSSVYI